MAIRGMHHVGCSTPDLERLMGFYMDAFGFEIVARTTWAGDPSIDAALELSSSSAEMVMLRLGDVFLELFEFASPDPGPSSQDRPVSEPGINHICLAVDSVDAEVARLVERGMRFHSPPLDIGDGPFVYGRDPDGNVIELWETELGPD